MKKFKNWLTEDKNLKELDKSEGHKRAELLMNYIDPEELVASAIGIPPKKSVVFRFLSIVDSLPPHEKIQFQQQIADLQKQFGLMPQQEEEQQEEPEKKKNNKK